MGKNILIISGEASGDLHGSFLIKALKRLEPTLNVKGMGGEKMRAAGLEGVDSTPLSVVGIVEVLEKFPKIRRAFGELKDLLYNERFDCVVLIDYPDFNLRFAREAKKRGIPVIYYISPQVWAWRKNRVNEIARLIDKMLVVFPFEVPLYRDAGVDVEYVGHPLADLAVSNMTKARAREVLGINKESVCVSLLPGSRSSEVRRLLGPMLRALGSLEGRLGHKLEVLLPAADTVEDSLLDELLRNSREDIKILRGRMHEALRASDAAVVASGTATLETALIGTPMVIAYRVSLISYLIGRLLIEVDYVGLPNIVAGKKVVPEFFNNTATTENIAEELFNILNDKKRRETMVDALSGIRGELGGHGAAEKAAAAVYRMISADAAPVKQGGALA
jgi:lipid-A-disaccharide synthase